MNNILKDLRKSMGLTQKQFAEKINITEACYKNYENGYSEMPYDILIKVADFHNILVDSIVGRKFLDINFSSLSSTKLELIKKIAAATDEQCLRVLSYLDGLNNK